MAITMHGSKARLLAPRLVFFLRRQAGGQSELEEQPAFRTPVRSGSRCSADPASDCLFRIGDSALSPPQFHFLMLLLQREEQRLTKLLHLSVGVLCQCENSRVTPFKGSCSAAELRHGGNRETQVTEDPAVVGMDSPLSTGL